MAANIVLIWFIFFGNIFMLWFLLSGWHYNNIWWQMPLFG